MNQISVLIVIILAFTVLPESFKDQGDENKGIPEHGRLGYNFQIKDSGVTFQWRKSRNNVYEMSMSSDQDGYVAVGFCDPMTRFSGEGMENCDIVLGWIDNKDGTPRIADLFCTSEGLLTIDEKTDYQLRPGSKQDGDFTVIKFQRLVDTKDPQDTALKRPIIIIWAWNENDPVWDDSTSPPQVKIGTIIKHRSSKDEAYQTPSRGHTPVTVRMDRPLEDSSVSASSTASLIWYLLIFSGVVGIMI